MQVLKIDNNKISQRRRLEDPYDNGVVNAACQDLATFRTLTGEPNWYDQAVITPVYDATTHVITEDYDPITGMLAVRPKTAEELLAERYIPQEISRAKGLVICKQYGILDEITAVVAAKDLEDGISQLKFDNAGTFRRDDPLLAYVASAVGLTEAQLDTMFIEGEALWS
jgi:hypothetical protein